MKQTKRIITDEEIIQTCNESLSMASAAAKLQIHYGTFQKRATELGVYKPNQGLKGGKRALWKKGYKLKDILEGKYPQYQTFKLHRRILDAGIKECRCEICGLTEWNGKIIPLELHHKDGDRTNHKLENLVFMCLNCHAQTETFRGKNMKGVDVLETVH